MARAEISQAVLVTNGTDVSVGAGASVQVNVRGDGAATVYADESSATTLPNPLTTDAAGRIDGWLDVGSYDLVVSGDFPTYTQPYLVANGPAGANGTNGAPGPAGAGANWRGVWSSATTYAVGDGAYRNGIPYISNTAGNLNHDPATDTGTNWGYITGNQGAGLFDVKAYGAKGDNTTDDTAAIQAAYDAAVTAGGGTVYFPPGVYLLSSALRTSHPSAPGVTFNTQIALWGSSYQSVAFMGPVPASGTGFHPGVSGPGAVIRSSATGSGTQPSVIGTATDATHILVRLHFENIYVICAPSLTAAANDPTLGGLDLTNAWGATLYEVKVTNGDEYPNQNGSNWTGITATHPAARGIALPHTWASSPVGAYHIQIVGFYAGLVTSEHVVADDVLIFRCKIAVVPELDDVVGQNFPARIGKLCVCWCQYGIAYATVTAGLTEIPAGSTSHLFVDCYENEQGSNDAVTVWDIYDPNSGVAGERLIGTVGFGHNPQHHPRVFARTVAWYYRSGGEMQVYAIGDANMLNGWTGLVHVWIDRIGVVHLDGLIATGTSGLTAFNLPAPLRSADEAGSSRYPALNPDTGAYGNLQIATNGDITPWGLTKAEFHCQFLSYDRWHSPNRPVANISYFLSNVTPV